MKKYLNQIIRLKFGYKFQVFQLNKYLNWVIILEDV